MSKDAQQTLRNVLLWLLVGPGVLAGTAVTWGAAWVGLNMASSPHVWGCTCRHRKLSAAKMRVKAGRNVFETWIAGWLWPAHLATLAMLAVEVRAERV